MFKGMLTLLSTVSRTRGVCCHRTILRQCFHMKCNNLLPSQVSFFTQYKVRELNTISSEEEYAKKQYLPNIQTLHENFKSKHDLLSYVDGILDGDCTFSGYHIVNLLRLATNIKDLSDAGALELSKEIWHRITDYQDIVDITAWNEILSIHISSNTEFDSLKLLKDIWKKSSSGPNDITYKLLLHSYAQKGDSINAMKVIQFFIKEEKEINIHMYEYLIASFAKGGDLDGAKNVINSIDNKGIQWRQASYDPIIGSFAEQGDLGAIQETLEDMISKNIVPSSHTYINLFDHLLIGGHGQLIQKIWPKFVETGYSKRVVRPLIQRSVLAGDYHTAIFILKNTEVINSKKKVTFHRFLRHELFFILHEADKELTEYLTLLSVVDNFLNDDSHLGMLDFIMFLAKVGKTDVSYDLLKSVVADEIKVSRDIFYSVIQSYIDKKCVDKVMEVMEYMLEKGISLDHDSYGEVLSKLAKFEDDEYLKVLSWIKKNQNFSLPSKQVHRLFSMKDLSLRVLSDAICSIHTDHLFEFNELIEERLIQSFESKYAVQIILDLKGKGHKNINKLVQKIVTELVDSENIAVGEVVEFTKDLVLSNISNDRVLTKILSYLQSKNLGNEFFDFVNWMKENNIELNVHHHYHILVMSCKAGNVHGAQFSFDHIIVSNELKKLNKAYEWLIVAYYNNTKKRDKLQRIHARRAISLFQEMVSKHYTPSDILVKTIITCHLVCNDKEGADKVINMYLTEKEK